MRRGAARPGRIQPDLLDWLPPMPTVAYAPEDVQAPTLAGRLARTVAAALRDCPLPRDQVAERMSDHLGRRISANMLNAYASQARADHVISSDRYVALMHATADRRLLQEWASPMKWAVVDAKYLSLIALATIRERQDHLARIEATMRQQARQGGLL